MLKTRAYGNPPSTPRTRPVSVVPGIPDSLARPRTVLAARAIRSSSSPALTKSRPSSEANASTAVREATSPALWPPIPSATTNTGEEAKRESSFSSRIPMSVANPQRAYA